MSEALINALAREFDARYHGTWSLRELHAIEAAFRFLGRGADGQAAVVMGESCQTLALWLATVDRWERKLS